MRHIRQLSILVAFGYTLIQAAPAHAFFGWLFGGGSSRPPHRIELLTPQTQTLPTMIIIPGAGANWRVPQALARAFERQGIKGIKMIGSTEAGRLIRELDEPIVVAGHSAGGGEAAHLAGRYSDKIVAAVLLNPYVPITSEMPVPTLLVRGTADDISYKEERKALKAGGVERVKLYVAQGGDHSLRYLPNRLELRGAAEREAMQHASKSPETRLLRGRIARNVAKFMRAHRPR